jgi:hypothetical protein
MIVADARPARRLRAGRAGARRPATHRSRGSITRLTGPPAGASSLASRGSTSNWWNGGGDGQRPFQRGRAAPHGLWPPLLAPEGTSTQEEHAPPKPRVGAERRDQVPAGEGVGLSTMRRGMPARPRKCCGKKHRLTPMNVSQKCSLADASRIHVAGHLREPVVPAAEDAKTAPSDST